MNRQKPTALVFLDIDDVLCMNDRVGGYDAFDAVNDRHGNPEEVYRALFVLRAREVLRQIHDQMEGRLQYVISSTWRQVFDRGQLETVFRASGLGFVADCIYAGDAWCTPSHFMSGYRADEIAQWLDRHHTGEPFVILDDNYSGLSLAPALTNPAHPFTGRVVLCEECVGLLPEHVEPIVAALRLTPASPGAQKGARQ